MDRLLRLRRRLKARKPEFRRYESHKKLRLRDKGWRRPRGRHSKLRQRYGGKWSGRILVNIGFGSPKAVRGLHPSGKEDVLVYNPQQLEGIDPTRQAVRIAASVGMKKRLMIEEKAKEMGIVILNPTQR
ncbi:50S ribosomal protein L32e [Archaeoglobus veneficus]|uniref:Large ribosomal subunit protein eL32 n=1 Tax=Archaeoglobus veneficus (strain DSM 11195 / SNP6) TaxID=693661 RepID=F2KST4_ARCVS|nr:50S ribosomal protein L32e [Archaeoglobus veneficus]AEA46979.1 50S ribosomal protein L32e [Archaeoglobus veneficus SNP6]